jgi:ribosomal protein L35AE/L33A
MYTIIGILLLFLIAVFSILLFFKSKKDRQSLLDSGECPSCHTKTKSFTDEKTGTTFKVEVIKTRVIKKHGCSGIVEIEYRCNNCGLKEIHNSVGQSCGL